MDKNVEAFIARKDERKNSAYAKLKLLVYGVKDNPKIFEKYQNLFKEEYQDQIFGIIKPAKEHLLNCELATKYDDYNYIIITGGSHLNTDEEYILELYRYASELYHKYNYKPFFDAGVLRNSLANEVYEGLL